MNAYRLVVCGVLKGFGKVPLAYRCSDRLRLGCYAQVWCTVRVSWHQITPLIIAYQNLAENPHSLNMRPHMRVVMAVTACEYLDIQHRN